MQNQEGPIADKEMETSVSIPISEFDDWANFADDDIMQQQSAIHAEEAKKIPFVGNKEPLSMLAAEYESGSPILLEKIKMLGQQYAAIRRTQGDGNCFFQSFMFSYLEHILGSQDRAEVDRIKGNVKECRKTLQSLGYADFSFEDFFGLFLEQLDIVLQGNEDSISLDELIIKSRDQSISNYEPMGEESDHVDIAALSDALGVPIRVVYLDRSFCDKGGVCVNHHDFVPTFGDHSNASSHSTEPIKPFITLLYRPGHYDILNPK
ncbi:ubiquitin thioesterase otubain-like isoform X2 [Durio zibethinus]|uniref:ubiquitinyl hydrolase 1 n=1 Tax=Durio zibethinus TaxID=66656 RepID=A0A6P6AH72_DURZI|nr:ubiquitin thioesterase otubain-like isoform X2 [Durio zibethinus]